MQTLERNFRTILYKRLWFYLGSGSSAKGGERHTVKSERMGFAFFFLINFILFFKLYIIVLVLPNIKMGFAFKVRAEEGVRERAGSERNIQAKIQNLYSSRIRERIRKDKLWNRSKNRQ